MPGRGQDRGSIIQAIRSAAIVPKPATPTLSSLVADSCPKNAQFVLIGEASHGTDEFYRLRADITKALITDHGFNAVACEADFPDAFRANLYARNMNNDNNAEEALSDFIRFPEWMWRNEAVAEFLTWLRAHNDDYSSQAEKAGFYGIDVYSLHTSAAHVVDYLQDVDPQAAEKVSERYSCFYRYGEDAQDYGRATGLMRLPSCANDAIAALKEVLMQRSTRSETADGEAGWELQFSAECNAAVVSGAEQYYRNMYFGDELTWNLRDTHFVDTVGRITNHLSNRLARESGGGEAKIVVWAHNSHLGDASATDMSRRGETNLGEIMRERYGKDKVFNIGFSTYHGSVAAANEWNTAGERKEVRPGMPGSYEALFHEVGIPEFAVNLRSSGDTVAQALAGPLLQRAIGVIYRPKTERQSHYYYADLSKQFDLMIHIDKTHAVKPLRPAHHSWEEEHLAKEDMSETFPFGV